MTKCINKKDKLYYARIIPNTGIYEVCELTVRTIADSWFAGIDKRDKHVYLFNFDALDNTVFEDRETALKLVQNAEKNKIDIPEETYYEEY